MFDREKIFHFQGASHRMPAPASVRCAHRGEITAAMLSILFALAGLRYVLHKWHHPEDPSRSAVPLLGSAILLGA